MNDTDRCTAHLAPKDVHTERCVLPAGHDGDHEIHSPGAFTLFPEAVAEHETGEEVENDRRDNA